MQVALTIAGSDSGGGAGIQADIKSMQANGVFAASVVTAVTAQNTREVRAVHEIPVDVVRAQIDAVLDDLPVRAIKTGMLGSTPLIEAVAGRLRGRGIPIVVDPVMISKSGFALLADDAVDSLIAALLPLAEVVTPNVPEAERLSGVAIRGPADLARAARAIHAMGPRAVLVKGGHLEGPESTDLLFDGATFRELSAPRIDTRNTHGTGCTYASAIAAWLARGEPVAEAAARAKAYVTEAIRHGLSIGRGHGPTNHFWFLDPGPSTRSHE